MNWGRCACLHYSSASRVFIYQFYFTVEQGMAEDKKHSLRTRRPARTTNSEEEEGNPYNYSRQAYSPSLGQLNAPAQLNLTAKQLVKFCNNLNKRYRESFGLKTEPLERCTTKPIETENSRDRKEGKVDKSMKIPKGFRTVPNGSEVPVESLKKSHPTEGHQNGNKILSDSLTASIAKNGIKSDQSRANDAKGKNDMNLNRMKGLASQSAAKMMSLDKSMGINQMGGNIGMLNINNFAFRAPPNLGFPPGHGLPSFINQQAGYPSYHLGMNGLIGFGTSIPPSNGILPMNSMNILEGPNRQIQEPAVPHKLFKRASYHVAVAYHIHIKKCKEKGLTGADIDPTLYTRKLKQASGIKGYVRM